MRDRFSDYFAVLLNKITAHQKEAIKFVCFTLGIFFAFCFPKTAKRLRSVLAVSSFILILPTVCKLITGIRRDVKRLTA